MSKNEHFEKLQKAIADREATIDRANARRDADDPIVVHKISIPPERAVDAYGFAGIIQVINDGFDNIYKPLQDISQQLMNLTSTIANKGEAHLKFLREIREEQKRTEAYGLELLRERNKESEESEKEEKSNEQDT